MISTVLVLTALLATQCVIALIRDLCLRKAIAGPLSGRPIPGRSPQGS
jgi:hypothetical protein